MARIISCLLGMGFWWLFSGIWQDGRHKVEIIQSLLWTLDQDWRDLAIVAIACSETVDDRSGSLTENTWHSRINLFLPVYFVIINCIFCM